MWSALSGVSLSGMLLRSVLLAFVIEFTYSNEWQLLGEPELAKLSDVGKSSLFSLAKFNN